MNDSNTAGSSKGTGPLAGQVAFVSGSGRGLGHTIGQALMALGADLAIHDISEDAPAKYGEFPNLTAVADSMTTASARAVAVTGDISDEAAVAAMIAKAEAALGPITGLHGAPAYGSPGPSRRNRPRRRHAGLGRCGLHDRRQSGHRRRNEPVNHNAKRRRLPGCALILSFAALIGSGSAVMAQATPPSDEILFRQRCGSCHTIQPGVNRMGPSLHGVMGRRAGVVAGYNYSPALVDWGQSWSAENMELYLAGSRAAVPGTKMNIAPPPPAQRQAIIRYLQSQR